MGKCVPHGSLQERGGDRHQGNDVAFFFKRLLTVLFAANRSILLEKWEPSEENPISKAMDKVYDESTIAQYYVGMKAKNDKRSIIGHTRILSIKSSS